MTKTVLAGGLVLVALGVGACGAGKHDRHGRFTANVRATQAPVLPGTGKPPVTIGDKNFTEQFLLGELYAEALSAQGYTVQLNRNIGPTEVTLQALYSGRLDMYPEYLEHVEHERRRLPPRRSPPRPARTRRRATTRACTA